MVSFYTNEEIVVADLLCHRGALLRDTVVAQVLRLPDRQVRQALERRLVPEGLVERLAEGTGTTRQQTYYRISHLAIRMTDKRLQAMEDAMAVEVEEEYRCPRCEGSFTSLEAVTLQQRQLENGTVAFLCGSCGDQALTLIAESATARHERLQKFRQQCRELLDLTREIKDMQVPLFEKEEKAKEATPAPSPTPQPAAPKAGPIARPEGIDKDGWFTQEVLGGFNPDHLFAKGVPQQPTQSAPDATDDALREAVKAAHAVMMEERARRPIADVQEWAPAHLKQASSDVVMVQGEPHPLAQVRKSNDLQDRMTDDEYQRFFDLERQGPAT